MSDMLLFNKIRLAREGSAVERCHVHPHQMRYSVGHHSLDLVTLIVLSWQYEYKTPPTAKLLIAAAFHDIPERITGDVPQPVKVLCGEKLVAVDERVLDALDVNTKLSPKEAEWLAVADKVELYLWAIEETCARGNTYFFEWVLDYDDYFMKNPPPRVFTAIMWAAKANCGRKLSFSFLKEVVGL